MSVTQKRRGDLLHEDMILIGDIPATGESWRSGVVVPDNSVGINGDYYFRTDTKDVYQRQSGVYAIVGNLNPGSAGAEIEDADTMTYYDGGDPSSVDTDILDFGTP